MHLGYGVLALSTLRFWTFITAQIDIPLDVIFTRLGYARGTEILAA
jgi:hypothetical protein